MGPPVVVNRHWYKGKRIPSPWRYIGRGTPLGNPFTVDDHGPEALELYRRWLWSKIVGRDASVLKELASIQPEEHLVCSCKPRPCHGDVVVRAWIWAKDKGIIR
jgi:hypothetical protein